MEDHKINRFAALTDHIKAPENENAASKRQMNPKRPALTPATSTRSTGSQAPAAKKTKKDAPVAAQKGKKLLQKWAKALRSKSAKQKVVTSGCCPTYFTVVIQESTSWSKDEFDSFMVMEGESGVILQPTPETKPRSPITIVDFGNYPAVHDFFGPAVNLPKYGYKTNAMERGSFTGVWDACVEQLEIRYNKNKHTLELRFTMFTCEEGTMP